MHVLYVSSPGFCDRLICWKEKPQVLTIYRINNEDGGGTYRKLVIARKLDIIFFPLSNPETLFLDRSKSPNKDE